MTHIPLLLALLAPAHAGAIYINGIRGDDLREKQFTDCTVRIDKDGNIWIDAPNYSIKVVQPTATDDAPAPPVGGVQVGVARYWMVTEDNDSTGNVVEVFINGVYARRIRSGDPQLILDVGPWLRPGDNEIRMTALPGTPGGGIMHVFLGEGSNNRGTVKVDKLLVDFPRRATDDPAGTTRTFTVQAQ